MPGTGNGAESLVEEGDERSKLTSRSGADKEEAVVTFLRFYVSTGQDSEKRSSLEGLGICDLQADTAHWGSRWHCLIDDNPLKFPKPIFRL